MPQEVRAITWQLLLSYLPANSERRVATLERKRKEYLDGVRQAFERGGGPTTTSANTASTGRTRGLDEAIWHQISIDVPRTNPHIELYSYEATQRSLERILYLWAVRHPASGYVQGINDLVTPFWQVFLGIYIGDPDIESGMDPGQLPKSVLDAVEADSFWCLTKLLDGIQDHYIVAQPRYPATGYCAARLDSAYRCQFVKAFRAGGYRVHPIQFPLDELSLDARIQCQKHYSNVGHLFGLLPRYHQRLDKANKSTRPKSRVSPNSICMCVRPFL